MSEDKIKKTRRQWLFDIIDNVLSTKEEVFEMGELTQEAELFLKLYGCKQYLADCISNKGGVEFSDGERAETMNTRFSGLCSDKFKIVHTESGFYFKDPDAIVVRGGGIKITDLVQGLVDSGNYTEEEALAFAIKLSQR